MTVSNLANKETGIGVGTGLLMVYNVDDVLIPDCNGQKAMNNLNLRNRAPCKLMERKLMK